MEIVALGGKSGVASRAASWIVEVRIRVGVDLVGGFERDVAGSCCFKDVTETALSVLELWRVGGFCLIRKEELRVTIMGE